MVSFSIEKKYFIFYSVFILIGLVLNIVSVLLYGPSILLLDKIKGTSVIVVIVTSTLITAGVGSFWLLYIKDWFKNRNRKLLKKSLFLEDKDYRIVIPAMTRFYVFLGINYIDHQSNEIVDERLIKETIDNIFLGKMSNIDDFAGVVFGVLPSDPVKTLSILTNMKKLDSKLGEIEYLSLSLEEKEALDRLIDSLQQP